MLNKRTGARQDMRMSRKAAKTGNINRYLWRLRVLACDHSASMRGASFSRCVTAARGGATALLIGAIGLSPVGAQAPQAPSVKFVGTATSPISASVIVPAN